MKSSEAPSRGRPRARNEVEFRGGLLGGTDPTALVAEFGTPLFVYDLRTIDRQVQSARAQFDGRRFELAFSVKANPSLAIVGHMRSLGLGLCVCSAGELDIGRQLGFPGPSITFVGPAKSAAELTEAAAYGVVVSVESPEELRQLSSIAMGLGTRASVVLRRLVAAFPPLSEARIFGDFLLDKFGMTDGDLRACMSMAPGLPGVELVGLHAFRGSNIHDVDTLISHFDETIDLACQLFGTAQVPLRVVNVGGGLAIPIEVQDDELDMGLLGRRLARLEARWDASLDMAGVTIRLEPGRFLVGPAGAYLVRVLSVKAPHGETVAIVDGGINHLLRPTLFGQEHRVRLLARSDERHRPLVSVSLAGPLTSAIDVIARSVPMPRPELGDLIAVLDVGAYGFTEAMPYFGSRAVPAEVVVMDGRRGLARPRLESSGILERQSLVEWDG